MVDFSLNRLQGGILCRIPPRKITQPLGRNSKVVFSKKGKSAVVKTNAERLVYGKPLDQIFPKAHFPVYVPSKTCVEENWLSNQSQGVCYLTVTVIQYRNTLLIGNATHGINFRADFFPEPGGAPNENGGVGKVALISFHRRVARRLHFSPCCRENQF